MSVPKRVAVIGAGPAGLCIAWKMLEKGSEVSVYEQESQIGGLSKTIVDGDYRLDLGPHNLHTSYRSIQTFLEGILGEDLADNKFSTQILYRDRFINYPLKGLAAFCALPSSLMPGALLSFLAARIRVSFGRFAENASFQDWIKWRYGTVLYDEYFAPYVEKVWKIPASQISSYVGTKRVPELEISDYFRKVFGVSSRHPEQADWIAKKNCYPRYGVGQVCDYFAREIGKRGGTIHTKSIVVGVKTEGQRVVALEYESPRGRVVEPVDFLFSTMPLDRLIAAIGYRVPSSVSNAAKQLDYCAMVLLYLKVARKEVLDSSILYFNSPEIAFNRVYDIRKFSSSCTPHEKTALCFEYTCRTTDDPLRDSEDILYNHALDVLQNCQAISRSEIEGSLVRRITHAYPRFRVGFQQRVFSVLDYLSQIDNLLTIGRQGLFRYANVDEAIRMALLAAEMIEKSNSPGSYYAKHSDCF